MPHIKIEDTANPLMRSAERTESSNDHAARDTERWNHGEHKDLKFVTRKVPLAEEGKFGYVADLLTEAEAKKREAEEKKRETEIKKEKERRGEEEKNAAARREKVEKDTRLANEAGAKNTAKEEANGERVMLETLSEESGLSKEEIEEDEEYEEEEQAIDATGRERRIVVKKKRPRKR